MAERKGGGLGIRRRSRDRARPGIPTLEAAVGDLTFVYATTARSREVAKPVVGPHEAATTARRKIAAGNRAGILFGRERTGLTNEEVALADAILTLPVDPTFASLNIAQAVLIVAYEWRLANDASLPFDDGIAPQAPRSDLIGMFDHLEKAWTRQASSARPSAGRTSCWRSAPRSSAPA